MPCNKREDNAVNSTTVLQRSERMEYRGKGSKGHKNVGQPGKEVSSRRVEQGQREGV